MISSRSRNLAVNVAAIVAIVFALSDFMSSSGMVFKILQRSAKISDVDKFLKGLPKGNAVFNPPQWMVYGDTQPVQLFLDPAKAIDELEKMVPDQGAAEGHEVRFSDRMEAKLTGDGFQITPATSEIQAVSRNETTKWQWDIRPTWFGTQTLHLSLNALVKVNGENTARSMETLNRTVAVQVVWPDSVSPFARDHYALLAGVIAAFFVGIKFLIGFRRRDKPQTGDLDSP